MSKRLIQVANAEGLKVNEVDDCLVQNFCSLRLVWCENPLVFHLCCALLTEFEPSKLYILDVAHNENPKVGSIYVCAGSCLMKGIMQLQESQGIYKSVTECTLTKIISSCTKSEGLIKF